jgi:sugar O-acyltransferase (sialic acid O-acetyltransferase NeuD family)
MQKEPLIVLGFGGNAIDFFETISHSYNIIGFVDDDESKHTSHYNGIKVYGREFLEKNNNTKVISMIGSEKTFRIRNKIIDKFKISLHRFATIIHPNATVSANANIGYDVIIMSGVVITSNARIGNHIFILANTVMHHDVEIEDYTLLGSNISLAGHVKIGRNCFIGSCTSVKNNISIGEYSIVGMSSNIVKNLPSYSKSFGNPAKTV